MHPIPRHLFVMLFAKWCFDKIKNRKNPQQVLANLERGLIVNNRIDGSLEISNGVLADLVGYAALECYGIVGVADASKRDAFLKILPQTRLRRGIRIDVTDSGVFVEVNVVVEYGTNIAVVCDNLRERIQFILKEYAGVDDVCVNVNVCDVNVR